MADYRVQFQVFEGPLDLLLYLVKKEEVDIYQVNLTKLASQFIEYVELMRQMDLDIAGEFLVMAATLMYIKSRELLPVDQQTQVEGEEEDEDDPRWELIRRLVEYKKFKDAAGQLQALELRQADVFPRQPGELRFERPAIRPEVSVFDLINAVSVILRRFQERGEARDIFADRWTVSEKIELIRKTLTSRPRLRFSELFETSTSRSEVVATFLALLELIRLKVLVVSQAVAFGEIEVQVLPTISAPPPASSSTTVASSEPAAGESPG